MSLSSLRSLAVPLSTRALSRTTVINVPALAFSRRTWDEKFNRRTFHTFFAQNTSRNAWKILTGTIAVTVLISTMTNSAEADSKVDYDAVRKDIESILENSKYDDGSYGPVILRLAWHAAGTYDKGTGSGGSDGSTMRFHPESAHGANAGLGVARDLLEQIKKKHPGITYADLWSLAGVVAVEAMGGPKVPWRPGRTDKPDGTHCTPDGRLPDAAQGAQHVRDVFYRMGFTDKEIVALVGAHAVGRCHTDRSGYSGPWTRSPTTFSNDYFEQLLINKWTKKKWNGPEQFEDPTGQLMMLPADLALIQDPELKKYVEIFAKDENEFFTAFSSAFQKLEELGVKFPEQKAWWKFW